MAPLFSISGVKAQIQLVFTGGRVLVSPHLSFLPWSTFLLSPKNQVCEPLRAETSREGHWPGPSDGGGQKGNGQFPYFASKYK
jgi:hypothetical protein